MKPKHLISSLIGIVVLIAYVYIRNSGAITHSYSHISTLSQNIATVSATDAGISSAPSQCQAIHTNSSDPEAYLPDGRCTPGVINPDVRQATIATTICRRGYTKTIRPSVSYTDNLKIQQLKEYGYSDQNPRDYEEDHFISLELGGNPSDPKNLWPEPHASINEKDKVENFLHSQICSGQLTLTQAQSEITKDWYTVYTQYNL